jgi:hypothetical protein
MALRRDKMALHRDKMALHHDKMALRRVQTQNIASLLCGEKGGGKPRPYVQTQYIASLQIDAINDTLDDHSIVRCRDAISCVSIASPLRLHCVSIASLPILRLKRITIDYKLLIMLNVKLKKVSL